MLGHSNNYVVSIIIHQNRQKKNGFQPINTGLERPSWNWRAIRYTLTNIISICFYVQSKIFCRSHHFLILLSVGTITARKRSLRKGTVFTPVCDSVHGGGVCPIACWDTPPWADIPRHTPPGRPPVDTPLDTTGYGQNRAICNLLECILVTTHKQSLGQGNIFTPVCHSVHGGGAWSQRGVPGRGGVPGPGGVTGGDPPGRLI